MTQIQAKILSDKAESILKEYINVNQNTLDNLVLLFNIAYQGNDEVVKMRFVIQELILYYGFILELIYNALGYINSI
jgi:hypothetical protein